MLTEDDKIKENKGTGQSGWRGYLVVLGILALFSSGLFSRCANIGGTLQGGPKDTLPPLVLRMTPAFNATNIRPSKIVIDFDEYIQLKDVQDNFFTSPFMEKKPVLSAKNKSAIITIDSPLDSATTYVFNLGSSVVDNNEGNPLHNLKYTFSTGEYIDSMFMSGFVSNALTADTAQGAYIFFYDARLDTGEPQDSLLFNTGDAAAVTRTLTDGGFVFSNLKPMDYRVYVLVDHNKNQMYDPGTDEVAFMDTVFNPGSMPSFMMWYDSLKGHAVAEPQLFFRTFMEEPERRQNLSAHTRPRSQELILKFSAKNPLIDSFTLEGIDMERVMMEQPLQSRDSIIYWIDIPADELPDTLVGNILYERHDSIGELYNHSQALRFVWRKPFVAPPRATVEKTPRVSRRERKRQEAEARRLEQLSPEEREEERLLTEILGEEGELSDSLSVELPDTIPPSTMQFAFTGDRPVIPGKPPVLTFDLPVVSLDTAAVQFTRLPEAVMREEDGEKASPPEEIHIPLLLERDSFRIREYTLLSEWNDGERYELMIPRGAIRTIDGEMNDTIRHSFEVAREAEMGTITLQMSNGTEGYEYIVQLLSEKGDQVIAEIPHLTEGTHSIRYVPPGRMRLRMIEDRNGNGKWDTGSLLWRIQPELVRLYQGGAEDPSFDLPGKVEFELDIDLAELFKPRVHVATEIDEHDHDHDHMHGVIDTETGGELPVGEGRSNIRSSEPRVEGFEITDPKAEKRLRRANKQALKAQKRAERKARREASKARGRKEKVIPGYELDFLLDEELD